MACRVQCSGRTAAIVGQMQRLAMLGPLPRAALLDRGCLASRMFQAHVAVQQ